MKTYQFEGFFVTTDEDLSSQNPLAEFEVTAAQAEDIESGAILQVVEDELIIETPITE